MAFICTYRPLPSSKRFFSSSVSGCGSHTETGRLERSQNPDCGPRPGPYPRRTQKTPPGLHWPPGAAWVPGTGLETHWRESLEGCQPPRHPSQQVESRAQCLFDNELQLEMPLSNETWKGRPKTGPGVRKEMRVPAGDAAFGPLPGNASCSQSLPQREVGTSSVLAVSPWERHFTVSGAIVTALWSGSPGWRR